MACRDQANSQFPSLCEPNLARSDTHPVHEVCDSITSEPLSAWPVIAVSVAVERGMRVGCSPTLIP